MTEYIQTKVYLSDQQQQKFLNALREKSACSLKIDLNAQPNATLYLTKSQLQKLKKANTSVLVTFSVTQMKKQNGGFLPIVGAIGAKLLPVAAKALASAFISGAVRNAYQKIGGKGVRPIGRNVGKGVRRIGKKN